MRIHNWLDTKTRTTASFCSCTKIVHSHAALRCGLTLDVSIQSCCVLAQSYLRHRQTECHHITYNDSRDTVILHGIVIPTMTNIQVTVFWLYTSPCVQETVEN